MKNLNSLLFAPLILIGFFFSLTAWADDFIQDCEIPQQFHSFSDAMEAYQRNDQTSALQMFCSLALQGDDRAQFKLAEYYAQKIPSDLKQNLIAAHAWAKLSNYRFATLRKSKLVDSIETQLSETDLIESEDMFQQFAQLAGTGMRIDQQLEELDLDEIFQEYNKKVFGQTTTGSRIKGKKPDSSNTGAVHIR